MRTMSKMYQKASNIVILITIFKFLLLSFSLIYVDRFNSDMIENIYWGQEWQNGYYKHPPMFAWVAEIWMQIFNNNVYCYHLLTAFVFSVNTWLCFLLFRKIIDEKKAIIAIILMEGIVYSNFVNICFNANTLLFVFHPLICLFAYKITEKDGDKIKNWLIFGVLAGLCMLTKYSSGLIILGCGLYILYVRKLSIFRSAGFYLGLIVSLLIFAPHLHWIIANDWLPLHYISDQQERTYGFFQSRLVYTYELFLALMLNSIPFILAILCIIKKPIFNKVKISDNNSVFLLLLNIVPFFLMTIFGGVWVKDQWMIAHVFLMPCLFLWFINCDLTKKRLIGCIGIIFLFFIGVTMYLVIVYKNSPKFADTLYNIPVKSQRDTYLYLAKIVDQDWQNLYSEKPKYICSDENIAGGIAMYSREHNVLHVIPNCNLYISRWINAEDLYNKGLVVISKNNDINHKQSTYIEVKNNKQYKVFEMFDKPKHTKSVAINSSDDRLFIHFYKK